MNNLRNLRKAKGMTMKELGKRFGLSESTVSLYERGLHEPDLDTVTKIAAFFGVSVDYLLGNDQATPSDAQPDSRAEAKRLLEGLSDEQYKAALAYIKFLEAQK